MNNYKIIRSNNKFHTIDLHFLNKYNNFKLSQNIIDIKKKINKNTLQKLYDLNNELNKNIQLTNDKKNITNLINTHNNNIISLFI